MYTQDTPALDWSFLTDCSLVAGRLRPRGAAGLPERYPQAARDHWLDQGAGLDLRWYLVPAWHIDPALAPGLINKTY